jgi:hypothetical protein
MQCVDYMRRTLVADETKPDAGQGSGAAADGKAVGAPVKRNYKNGVAHVVNVPPCSPVSVSLRGRIDVAL